MIQPRVDLEIEGRYKLVERMAIGGMGEVWRATDLRSGRAVAAKILRPEFAGDEIFLSRLRAEAANSRGLRHPNLAVVLDSGERDGSGWIIMELVQGRPLSDILAEKGVMAPAEILPILAQVARALQVVHDARVVHRDVKPSNILINREGLAKLTDFGISTGVHQRPLTATGMVMGTAQYLSPEQAMGHMATPAGDLYALGIIAYESLVGSRPFTGATQVDIAFAHVNQPVPPMPDEISPEVQGIVLDLLAKDPAARPHSAREVARRLDRAVIHLPAPSWDPRGGVTWQSTGRQGVAGSGAAAAAADSDSPTTSSSVPGQAAVGTATAGVAGTAGRAGAGDAGPASTASATGTAPVRRSRQASSRGGQAPGRRGGTKPARRRAEEATIANQPDANRHAHGRGRARTQAPNEGEMLAGGEARRRASATPSRGTRLTASASRGAGTLGGAARSARDRRKRTGSNSGPSNAMLLLFAGALVLALVLLLIFLLTRSGGEAAAFPLPAHPQTLSDVSILKEAL